mgnify:CR=1 FL=1
MYYSIGEVAKMFQVNESLLRYWEKEFPIISPRKVGGNVRQYREEDIENIPGLKELREEINRLEEAFEKAKGKAKYSIKNNIIDLRKDQYVLRASYKKPIYCTNLTKSIKKLDIYEDIEIIDNVEEKGTWIRKGDKVGQFRIMEVMPVIEFEEVESFGNVDRGGFGSTGTK